MSILPWEEDSCSSSASDYSSSSSLNRSLSSNNGPNTPNLTTKEECNCDLCLRNRGLSREKHKSPLKNTNQPNDQYTKNLDGKYNKTISYSKTRKLMIP
jgi:hypothetical protein